jgi:hypothetical protein
MWDALRRRQWLLAALALLILLLIALANRVGAQQPKEPPSLYTNIPFDPALLSLDRRALDEAYHEYLLKLWAVWLSSGAPEDARNFKNGLNIARRAYGQAREQIRKREEQLNELDPNSVKNEEKSK